MLHKEIDVKEAFIWRFVSARRFSQSRFCGKDSAEMEVSVINMSEIGMNHQLRPVGTAGMTRFGWKLQSKQKNISQLAYQLQLA